MATHTLQQIHHFYDLQPLIKELTNRSPLLATVFLYGSRCRGTERKDSDIDLLVIDPSAHYTLESGVYHGIEVDLIRISEEELIRRLELQHPQNMNLYLNALIDAVSLHDPAKLSKSLRQRAETLYHAGPRGLTEKEICTQSRGIQKMITSAEKLSRRAQESGEAAYLARMHIDKTANKLLYLYFNLNRMWSKALPDNLLTLRNVNKPLYVSWLNYIDARSEAERAACLQHMAMLVFEGVKEIPSLDL